MQTVASGWTAEERDSVRRIAQNTQISWHKDSVIGNRTFTIGVSTIGGNDAIGINPGAVGSPANYRYFDESNYVTDLSWEHGLNMPVGGLSMGLGEVNLSNTTNRFTPRYMGGSSELYTAIQPGKPVLINAGFNYNGVDQTLPQFSGVVSEQPVIDQRSKQAHLKLTDYIGYFQNKFLDHAEVFTSQTTDVVMQRLLVDNLGMNTAQFDLDTGINTIPFGFFPSGARFSDIFNELAQAEAGHFYQDETGVFKFENRQHWDNAPYTQVQRVITTAQVIQAESPNLDHLINVVEVKANVRQKQPVQTVFTLSTPVALYASGDTSMFVSFEDPILSLDTPTSFTANTASDGSGTNITSSISVRYMDVFAQTAKITFTNSSISTGFLTSLTLTGRPAKISTSIYYQGKAGHSITAYQEKPITIENDFIQSQTWAESLAQLLLNDFSSIENLQRISIRAMPELQLGDLISWQGRYWRIYDIKTTLNPSDGYVQELLLLQRTITTYFRIGISTIGGTDKIAA